MSCHRETILNEVRTLADKIEELTKKYEQNFGRSKTPKPATPYSASNPAAPYSANNPRQGSDVSDFKSYNSFNAYSQPRNNINLNTHIQTNVDDDQPLNVNQSSVNRFRNVLQKQNQFHESK